MAATAVAAPAGTRCFRLSRARACWVKSGPVIQSRNALRMPFAEPVVVTPWNVSTGTPSSRSILAGGRDISEDGIAFRHGDSLPCRYVAVSFRNPDTAIEAEPAVESLLVRLLWCRFMRAGEYLSGGHFERMLPEEFGQPFATLLGADSNRLRVFAEPRS
jgi:hypothetical protein